MPLLLLVATLLFALSPRLLGLVRHLRPSHGGGLRLNAWTVLVLLPCLVYGGYFGAGLGIMLLAGLAVAGLEELRVANALKNGMSALVNGVAVAVFVSQGIVVWPAALTMMVGAALGGFAGARIARRLPQRLFRAIVIGVGSLLTVWYFVRPDAPLRHRPPGPRHDVLAPDGSEIRFLPQVAGGSMVHCTLPPGAVSLAVTHRTVDELWYVLSGAGELWRRQGEEERVEPLDPHTAHSIPLGHRLPVPQSRPRPSDLRHRHHAALARDGRGGAGRRSLAAATGRRPPSQGRPQQPADAPEQVGRSPRRAGARPRPDSAHGQAAPDRCDARA